MNLTTDAQRLLGAYQQFADLTATQEHKLQEIAGGDHACDAAQLQKILSPAYVQKASDLIKCDPGAGDNIFNTAIVGRPKVVKETPQVQVRRRVTQLPVRDPYYAKLEVDPRAAMVVIASGSKFEPNVDRPRPRLMKLVVRTEALDGNPTDQDWANLEKLLDKANTRKLIWDPKGDEVPVRELDVQWIGSKTASVETKDINEPEFDFGSGMLTVTVGPKGGELSRANATNPENVQRVQTYAAIGNSTRPNFARPIGAPQDRPGQDTTPPETFDRKIGVEITAKELPRGAWTDTPNVGAGLDVNLRLGSRWLMEPGASGSVTLLNTSIETKVKEDDVYLTGSTPGYVGVNVAENFTLASLLSQNVNKDFGRVATDRTQNRVGVQGLYFAQHNGVTVAGGALTAARNVEFAPGKLPGITVTKSPVADAQRDGLAFDIDLGPEFLTSPRSLKGFSLDVGIMGQNAEGEPEWRAASHGKGEGLLPLERNGCGDETKFCLRFDNFPQARLDGTPVDVIVRDPNNIPVARVRIPLDKVDWA